MFTRAFVALAIVAVCGRRVECASESTEETSKSMYYMCPPEFIRLGSSCYYFSSTAETWQSAYFTCKDKESNLTAPERWEDRNLRRYLNTNNIEKHDRWIGGMYDWGEKIWKWGGEMKEMNYQSFRRMKYRPPEELMFHCVAMVPSIAYRWDAFGCYQKKYFICQTKLKKVPKRERNNLRRKWNPNGNGKKPNEVTVPEIEDMNNEIPNNIRANPAINPDETRRVDNQNNNDVPNVLYPRDQARPNQNQNQIQRPKRPRPKNRKRKPFPGFIRNKEDPEAAYNHNLNALKSGRTGLTNAQIEKHLQRLERMRKREELALRRRENERDRLNREQNALIGQTDPSALYMKSNTKRGRKTSSNKSNSSKESKKDRKKNNKKNSSHSLENVTQKTFLMDNQISELHPKTIVEVHSFSNE